MNTPNTSPDTNETKIINTDTTNYESIIDRSNEPMPEWRKQFWESVATIQVIENTEQQVYNCIEEERYTPKYIISLLPKNWWFYNPYQETHPELSDHRVSKTAINIASFDRDALFTPTTIDPASPHTIALSLPEVDLWENASDIVHIPRINKDPYLTLPIPWGVNDYLFYILCEKPIIDETWRIQHDTNTINNVIIDQQENINW